jgi:hypothetical protein
VELGPPVQADIPETDPILASSPSFFCRRPPVHQHQPTSFVASKHAVIIVALLYMKEITRAGL